MLGEHHAIEVSQSSEYAKEMRKWEATHTRYGPPGRPYVYQEYPKMLYKCAHVAGKGVQPVEDYTVNDETQERNMNSRGYFPLQDAYDRAVKQQTEHGTLAAEREWQIQHGRLSDKAAAEVRAAEAEHGSTHMPDVPETPIKRRGRKPKATGEPAHA